MPRGDVTGPEGKGSRSGRRQGNCNPDGRLFQQKGQNKNAGRGGGQGQGRGRGQGQGQSVGKDRGNR